MTKTVDDGSGYRHDDSGTSESHKYLMPTTIEELELFFARRTGPRRVVDLGCGNDSVAALLSAKGFEVTGVDPSQERIALAKQDFPELALEVGMLLRLGSIRRRPGHHRVRLFGLSPNKSSTQLSKSRSVA